MTPLDRELQLRQCHCDQHKGYDPLCDGCRSALERRLELEKLMEAEGATLTMVDVSPPPHATEEELRGYFDRKRREAGGR